MLPRPTPPLRPKEGADSWSSPEHLANWASRAKPPTRLLAVRGRRHCNVGKVLAAGLILATFDRMPSPPSRMGIVSILCAALCYSWSPGQSPSKLTMARRMPSSCPAAHLTTGDGGRVLNCGGTSGLRIAPTTARRTGGLALEVLHPRQNTQFVLLLQICVHRCLQEIGRPGMRTSLRRATSVPLPLKAHCARQDLTREATGLFTLSVLPDLLPHCVLILPMVT